MEEGVVVEDGRFYELMVKRCCCAYYVSGGWVCEEGVGKVADYLGGNAPLGG